MTIAILALIIYVVGMVITAATFVYFDGTETMWVVAAIMWPLVVIHLPFIGALYLGEFLGEQVRRLRSEVKP